MWTTLRRRVQKPVEEDLVLLAGQPADRRERLRAFAVLGMLFLAFAIVTPFASIQLPAVETSLPAGVFSLRRLSAFRMRPPFRAPLERPASSGEAYRRPPGSM